MLHIVQHSYNFFSSRTPKPKLWIFSSRTPNPKLLAAKLEGTGTNPRPRIRPQDPLHLAGSTSGNVDPDPFSKNHDKFT